MDKRKRKYRFAKARLFAVCCLLLASVGATTLPSFTFQTSKEANSDASLATVRRQDSDARNARGVLTRLSPEEHLRRAAIYHANRAFDEAREHWQALMNYYPDDSRVAEALLAVHIFRRAVTPKPTTLTIAWLVVTRLQKKVARVSTSVAPRYCEWAKLRKQPTAILNTSIAFLTAKELRRPI
jgi:hypothetical protein